ncbi:E3 ubiquitin-protein ligase TRIM39-like [Amblyraja radiata]|uniref:E3 ubiquitin-protein ligase TRIM39-like n=1 Tax=Amblyraja radiata TaxID=386614 RepID=UPI0014027428|nr:E3 ubiquitin-protein ligase TRIM39-like [Amblyraja radiata]
MATKDQVDSLTKELDCPICLDFFTDPVSLECGHNFCRSCITQSWDREGRNSCPECREEFVNRTLGVSRALARLSDKFRTLRENQEKGVTHDCEEHQEELKLFCEADMELICVICAAGRKHKSHSFTLIAEAAEFYKDQVRYSFESLAKNKSEIQQMEQQQKQKISGVLKQSHNLQSQIASQFAELLYCNHYTCRISTPMSTSVCVTTTIRVGRWKSSGACCNLCETPTVGMGMSRISLLRFVFDFLQEQAGANRRESEEVKTLSVTDGALTIDKIDHHFLMNTLWRETSTINQVSVTLDVETAHPNLEVSVDRKGVRWTGTLMNLPDTGKRFTFSRCVLGSEGFTSGRHYWEVEVAGTRRWSLGVAAESVERKRVVELTPETGVWIIRRRGDKFDPFTSSPSRLPTRPIPGRVGVYLNYESGTVSFYDADTKSHLHTFTGNKFTEKLYPFFWTWAEYFCENIKIEAIALGSAGSAAAAAGRES